jgi:GT2 family glycosyltransferase
VARHLRAVVVCWNNRDVLGRCLEHLLASRWDDGRLDVVVVDNGSTDGSVDGLAARFPTVRVIETGANLGFAGGANAGLTDLDDVWAVALVNSDAFVEPGWLAPLAAALEDPAVGAACPKLLFAEPDPAGRPRINNAGNVLTSSWVVVDRGYGEIDAGQYDQAEDVWGWCGGAVLLSRRYLDDVGRFDERLFMYAEDADLSWRGATRGWRYRYEPRSVVHHLHRASSGGERTPLLDLLNRRNRLVVVSRHGGWRGRLGAWTRALGGIVAGTAVELAAPVRRRRPDWAAVGRRARAAWDAARLLAGGSPRLPTS